MRMPKLATREMNSALTWAGYLLGLVYGGLMLYRLRTGQQVIDSCMTVIMLLLVAQSVLAAIVVMRLGVENRRGGRAAVHGRRGSPKAN
jgi:hypothetical protein